MNRITNVRKLTNNTTRTLPRPGDPLALPDGRIVEPERTQELADTGIRTRQASADPTEYRAQARRTFKDLTASLNMFKACGVVYAMTLSGVGDVEICDLLHITPVELRKVRANRAYVELFENVMNELVNANSELLQSRIAAYAHVALDVEGSLLTGAKKEELQHAVAKDFLDRAGARPSDLAKTQANQMNEFRIVISHPDKETEVKVQVNGSDLEFESNQQEVENF